MIGWAFENMTMIRPLLIIGLCTVTGLQVFVSAAGHAHPVPTYFW